MHRTKLILQLSIISLLLILIISFSYAFFITHITGNDTANEIKATSSTLKVNFEDKNEISLENAEPGSSSTKTFVVKNTGSDTAYYKILWKDFNNTVTNDEITIKLSCTSNNGICSGVTEEAAYDRIIKDNIEITVDEIQTYSLTLTFIDNHQNQDDNKNKEFSGKIVLEGSTPRWDKNCENNNSLRCKIITENIPISDKNINFGKISSLSNGQGLYIDEKIGDAENYYFRGGTFCAYTGYESENIDGTKCTAAGGTWSNYKCSLDLSKETCESKNFIWHELKNNVKFGNYYWKIIRIDDNGDVRLIYNGTSTTSLVASTTIGGAKYNQYAGDSAYAGYMQPTAPSEYISSISENRNWWKTSNSTEIKMSKTYTYDKVTGKYTLTNVINGSYTDEYLGYYSCANGTSTTCDYLVQIVITTIENGTNKIANAKIVSNYFTKTKKQVLSNEIDSPVKSKNESWFETNLTSLSNKISSNAGYCNDRTSNDDNGGVGNTKTHFSAYKRIVNDKKPSFKCNNESKDLFTTSTSTYGNNKLSQPIGLITGDEVAYAGNVLYQYNHTNYLKNGYSYWTMTPSYYSGGLVLLNNLFDMGNFSDNFTFNAYGVRPVISLNSKAIVKSGDGSLTTPYIVE